VRAGTHVHSSIRTFLQTLKRIDRSLGRVSTRGLLRPARKLRARAKRVTVRLSRLTPTPRLLQLLRRMGPGIGALERSLELARRPARTSPLIRQMDALAIKLQRLELSLRTHEEVTRGAPRKSRIRARRAAAYAERRRVTYPRRQRAAGAPLRFVRRTVERSVEGFAGVPGARVLPTRRAKRPPDRRRKRVVSVSSPRKRPQIARLGVRVPPAAKPRPAARRGARGVGRGYVRPPEPAPRYANVELFDAKYGNRLKPETSLEPRQAVRLQIDIGKLSAESHVTDGTPFPDRKLPRDVHLDVMLSSTEFTLEGRTDNLAHGRFFLPGDGGPAVASNESRFLAFTLTAPPESSVAHCRIGYYFRNVLVQSQQLLAHVGQAGGFKITTDFTLTRDLTGFELIPERPRVSVLTNSNGNGVHQIVIRSVDAQSQKPEGQTFAVNDATLGQTISALRAALSIRAPTTKNRKRSDLEQDLRVLAPLGWTLYTQLPGQRPYLFGSLSDFPEKFVVQILRPTTSGFVVPWALMYEIPIISERPSVCPLVSNWVETKPLTAESTRTCPYGPHLQDVLCPFGFWGFRYAIEQLASSDTPVLEVRAASTCEMVAAQTQFGVDLTALAEHMAALRTILWRWLPNAQPREGKDKATIRRLLDHDLPLVYFYCHGERRNIADPNMWLSVGQREVLTAQEFIGWLVAWRTQNKRVWDTVRPLIFVNACHSVAVYPTTLVSYVDAFIGSARAAGVIGTETRVQQDLAASVAERLFDLLLSGGQTVESALRKIRFEYLAGGNLLGLLYTPYCWADLRIVPS
jgi:hypothetical protein